MFGRRFAYALLATVLFASGDVFSLDRKPELFGPIGPGVVAPATCEARALVNVAVRPKGLRLTGNTIDIDASTATIHLIAPETPENPASCRTLLFPFLPHATFAWALISQPDGSNAQLGGTQTLKPTLTLDVPGEYQVLFTACTKPCPFSPVEKLHVPPFEQVVLIRTTDAVQPATRAILPPQKQSGSFPLSLDEASARCPGAKGPDDWFAPQLVTVHPWLGAESYQLLEGRVVETFISRVDNNLNHESQDVAIYVDLDPASRHLGMKPGRMEIEWEWKAFREVFRPTRDDRSSAVGYWVLDCDHLPKSEIHPPVLHVSHRERAVRVPDSRGFGTNVIVPGIVSDLFVSRDGGEMTQKCERTTLHQPAGFANTLVPPDCLPFHGGFAGENPIDRLFTFNIYLPQHPKRRMTALGLQPPVIDVPLYTAVLLDHRTNQEVEDPRIKLTTRTQGDVTFLEVTLNLREFTGDSYSRRIVAAWVYPSPDNWGLRRWQLRLDSLRVYNNADGAGRGDGDWRFWVNTNNTDREWTKLIDCTGCVEEDGKDHIGVPWETGTSQGAHSLGPDLLLFPGQMIRLDSHGYDSDWNYEDGTGRVDLLLPQTRGNYATQSECSAKFTTGCGQYTLEYSVHRGDPVRAVLSAAGQAIYDAFQIKSSGEGAPNFPIAEPVGAAPVLNHPVDLVLEPGAAPVALTDERFGEAPEPETLQMHDISSANFLSGIMRLERQNPQLLATAMQDLRADVDRALRSLPREDVLADLPTLRDAMPPHLWEQHFGDIDLEPRRTPPLVWWLVAVIALLSIVILVMWLRGPFGGSRTAAKAVSP